MVKTLAKSNRIKTNSLLTCSKKNDSSVNFLTDRNTKVFKISIEHSLDNNFDFKKLNTDALKRLNHFIDDTVGIGRTISEVESIYLRTKGKVFEEYEVNGVKRQIIHFGKDRTCFRLHGYYRFNKNNQEETYFVLCKIDPNHDVHKEK